MTSTAIRFARNRVAAARRVFRWQRGNAFRRRERGFAAVLVPDIGCETPGTVREALDQAGLDRLAVRELLPQLRPGRKVPFVRPRGVDELAGGDVQPAPLGGPIRPTRALRGERQVLGPYLGGRPREVEAGIGQPLRQLSGCGGLHQYRGPDEA